MMYNDTVDQELYFSARAHTHISQFNLHKSKHRMQLELIKTTCESDMLQDRARNQSDRLSATTTLTVNVKDYDDQDPSFIYQNCMVLDGGCVNPEYHALVSLYLIIYHQRN